MLNNTFRLIGDEFDEETQYKQHFFSNLVSV